MSKKYKFQWESKHSKLYRIPCEKQNSVIHSDVENCQCDMWQVEKQKTLEIERHQDGPMYYPGILLLWIFWNYYCAKENFLNRLHEENFRGKFSIKI